MNSQRHKSGNALPVVVIVTIILLGSLGFIFWQNFINNNKNPEKISTIQTKIEYKTYVTDKYNFSFQYPSTWSITETKGVDDNSFYQRSVSIRNADGSTVAEFAVGMQLGGICNTPSKYSVLESELTSYSSINYNNDTVLAALSFTIIDNDDGSYGAHYGLTDSYISLGDGMVCSNTFYYNIHPSISGIYGLGFGNDITSTKKFSNIDDVRQYIKSDEYAQIKKMVLSLKY